MIEVGHKLRPTSVLSYLCFWSSMTIAVNLHRRVVLVFIKGKFWSLILIYLLYFGLLKKNTYLCFRIGEAVAFVAGLEGMSVRIRSSARYCNFYEKRGYYMPLPI